MSKLLKPVFLWDEDGSPQICSMASGESMFPPWRVHLELLKLLNPFMKDFGEQQIPRAKEGLVIPIGRFQAQGGPAGKSFLRRSIMSSRQRKRLPTEDIPAAVFAAVEMGTWNINLWNGSGLLVFGTTLMNITCGLLRSFKTSYRNGLRNVGHALIRASVRLPAAAQTAPQQTATPRKPPSSPASPPTQSATRHPLTHTLRSPR